MFKFYYTHSARSIYPYIFYYSTEYSPFINDFFSAIMYEGLTSSNHNLGAY